MEQDAMGYLPYDKHRIVKVLRVSIPYSGERSIKINVCYGRQMLDTYKMNSKGIKKSDRCLYGYTENEYPSDEIDDFMKESLANSFNVSIDSVNVTTSLLTHKIEFQKLQNSFKCKRLIMIEIHYELNPLLWEKRLSDEEKFTSYELKMKGFTSMQTDVDGIINPCGYVYYQDDEEARKMMKKLKQEVDLKILDKT